MKIVKVEECVPVFGEFDVVVAGGGPAGFAAGVAAAREGARTLIVERFNCLGGLGTAGLVVPFMITAGSEGGVFKQLLRKMEELGGAKGLNFDPEAFKFAAQEIALEAGCELLFHTFVEKAFFENGNVKGLFVANKAGRGLLLAKVVVDATGDGDAAASAGAPFEKGDPRDGRMQPLTLKMRFVGVDKEKERSSDLRAALEKWPKLREETGIPYWQGLDRGTEGLLECEVHLNPDMAEADGTDPWELTKAEIEARRRAWAIGNFMRENVLGWEEAWLIQTAAVIGVRETRRILGEYVLTGDDVRAARKFPDGIAKASFFIDIHGPDMALNWEEWLKRNQVPEGDWYEIPYRCLLPLKVDSLLVSGRCISSDREAQGSLRVMPTCMATGEAAGLAAAVCVKRGVKPRELDGQEIRAMLKERGADV